MRLQTRLVLLILATMLPLLAYSTATQFNRYRAAEQRAALGQAQSMARAVQQLVQARFVALRVLALEPELQTGDFERFRKAAEVLIANELPGSNVLVLTKDGNQVMNTAVPPGEPLLPRRNLESLRRVFETRQPVLSDLFVGAMLGKPVIAIEVPVRRPDGEVIYDLVLNPTPDAFLEPIRAAGNSSAIGTVFDRKGVVVSRSRGRDEFVGQKAPEPLLSYLQRGEEAVYRVASVDGSDRLVAVSRVDPFGWTVALEVPSDELSTAALASLIPTIAVGGLLVMLSAVLAAYAARGIARPIAALRRMGDDPSAGNWSLLARLPEVHDVALHLRDARARVEDRTRELEKTLEERDLLVREVYHRVKNNLQMVDSLVAMQGRRIGDHVVQEALNQLRNRVHALAVVHAQLMSSPDLRTFDAAGFLRQLAQNLSAATHAQERAMPVVVEADEAPITLDVAIPLGLLLTELITNSAKHASSAPGSAIRVQFEVSPERQARLVVEDGGDDPTAIERFMEGEHGLGAKLVKGFVKQLDGTMNAEFADGMRVTIGFPLPGERR